MSQAATSGVIGSHLTGDERRVARSAEIDLAVGYPREIGLQLLGRDWLARGYVELVEKFREATPATAFTTTTSYPSQDVLERLLLESVCDFLGIDKVCAEHGFVVHTGSHALDRVVAALATERPTYAVTTEPSIDVIPAIVSEHRIQTRFVVARTTDFKHDIDGILSAAGVDCSLVVLTSPENPTGAVIDAPALIKLSSDLADRGVPLVLDQCFARVRPFSDVPLGPTVLDPSGLWAVVWDTGKMFELRESKLGFIFCSAALHDLIRRRIEVLQCTLPIRPMMELQLVILDAIETNYAQAFSNEIRRNIELAEAVLQGSRLKPLRSEAGAFLLLDAASFLPNFTSDHLTRLLLERVGVGVIGGGRFFHSTSLGDRFIRVALARDQAILGAGLERIAHAIENI